VMGDDWTSRRRLLTAMRRHTPDRVPRNLSWGLAPAQEKILQDRYGVNDPFDHFRIDVRLLSLELHGGPNMRIGESSFYQMGPRQRVLKERFRAYLPPLPGDATVNEWGLAHLKTDSWHFTHMLAPLAQVSTVEELESFPFPRFDEPWRVASFRDAVESLQAQGLAVAGCINPGLSGQAEYMRGQQAYWIDMLSNPAYVECLLDHITSIRCQQVRTTAEAGVDLIIDAESIGSQDAMLINPVLWRKLYKYA
jgi:uroporphyrinogen decarboxylase